MQDINGLAGLTGDMKEVMMKILMDSYDNACQDTYEIIIESFKKTLETCGNCELDVEQIIVILEKSKKLAQLTAKE